MSHGMIEQRFVAFEGYCIAHPVFALCKPHKYYFGGTSGLSVCALLTTWQQRRQKPSRTRRAKFILDGFFDYFIGQ